jgi:hypothetical protein
MRPIQEDSFRFHAERGIFSVADGFGGPIPGANASECACESIDAYLSRGSRDPDATLPFVLRSYLSLAGNVLLNAVAYANQRILEENKKKNINERGGSSLVSGYLDGDLLTLASVGSCHAWLLRGDNCSSLITPRTYERLLSPADISGTSKLAGKSQTPLMALGLVEDLEPEMVEFKVKSGDWFILHTDGLRFSKDQAGFEKILDIKRKKLNKHQSAQNALSFMSEISKESLDNATILLVLL